MLPSKEQGLRDESPQEVLPPGGDLSPVPHYRLNPTECALLPTGQSRRHSRWGDKIPLAVGWNLRFRQ